jgi:hypothetical protein
MKAPDVPGFCILHTMTSWWVHYIILTEGVPHVSEGPSF